MNNGATQKLRILYLMQIFIEDTDSENMLTLAEITSKLSHMGIDVTRRTLYDDIEVLQVFGLDIQTHKSKSFCYYLAERKFELAEVKMLIDSVQCAKFMTSKKSSELISKIESLTSKHQAKVLNRQVYMTSRVKSFNESIYSNIDNIHLALNEKKKLAFKYSEYHTDKKLHYKRNGEEYLVSPYLLTWDNDNYYMVAMNDKYDELSNFRVDKMSQVYVTDQDAQTLENEFDACEYAKKSFSMFSGEGKSVDIVFDNNLIGAVLDKFGQDTFIIKNDEDSFRASVKAITGPTFYSWVIQFGRSAKIVAPEDVVSDMRSFINDVFSAY